MQPNWAKGLVLKGAFSSPSGTRSFRGALMFLAWHLCGGDEEFSVAQCEFGWRLTRDRRSTSAANHIGEPPPTVFLCPEADGCKSEIHAYSKQQMHCTELIRLIWLWSSVYHSNAPHATLSYVHQLLTLPKLRNCLFKHWVVDVTSADPGSEPLFQLSSV